MKHRYILIIVLLWAFNVYAQKDDTVQLKEIHFFQPEPVYRAGGKEISLDTSWTKTRPGATLGEALQETTSLYMKSYGPGMLSTPSFRGTGAEHTAVLWNGFNIALPSLGLNDFSTIPAYLFDNVTIRSGSSGALYGSGAVGGAIYLDNNPSWNSEPSVKGAASFYSTGGSFSGVSASHGTENIFVKSTWYYQSMQNRFKFRHPQYGLTRQDNASLSGGGFKQDIYIRNGGWEGMASLWASVLDRNIQPSMFAAYQGDERYDRNLRLTAGAGKVLNENLKTTLSTAVFNDVLDFESNATESLSRFTTVQVRNETQASFGDLGLAAGAKYSYQTGGIDAYGEGNVSQERISLFLNSKYSLSALQVALNLRQEFVPGYSVPFTPSLGAEYRVLRAEGIRGYLKGLVSAGYRIPTFNERFWPPGNPDLIPESSKNAEGGVELNVVKSRLDISAEVTAFYLHLQNNIVWLPEGPSARWIPLNFREVNSSGIEASLSLDYEWGPLLLSGRGNFARTRSVLAKTYSGNEQAQGNIMPYVPGYKGNVFVKGDYNDLFLSASASWMSERYTTPANDRLVEGYMITNITAGCQFDLRVMTASLSGTVHNIFNTDYQNYYGMAMPLRYFSLNLTITSHESKISGS